MASSTKNLDESEVEEEVTIVPPTPEPKPTKDEKTGEIVYPGGMPKVVG